VGGSCKRASAGDGCLTFGAFARTAINNGTARALTREQMRDVIADRRQRRLIFFCGNVAADSPNVICTCCDCCCHFLETVHEAGGMAWVAPARYRAAVDEVRCTHCGLCKPACGTHAHTVRRKVHHYDETLRVGCGNCVSACRENALSLIHNPRYRRPSPSFERLAYRLVPSAALVLLKAKLIQKRDP
jgi:ferredoxin